MDVINKESLDELLKEVIAANQKFQELDTEFEKSIQIFYNLTDEQVDYLFSNFGDIVDTIQYGTGNISLSTIEKHIDETKSKLFSPIKN